MSEQDAERFFPVVRLTRGLMEQHPQDNTKFVKKQLLLARKAKLALSLPETDTSTFTNKLRFDVSRKWSNDYFLAAENCKLISGKTLQSPGLSFGNLGFGVSITLIKTTKHIKAKLKKPVEATVWVTLHFASASNATSWVVPSCLIFVKMLNCVSSSRALVSWSSRTISAQRPIIRLKLGTIHINKLMDPNYGFLGFNNRNAIRIALIGRFGDPIYNLLRVNPAAQTSIQLGEPQAIPVLCEDTFTSTIDEEKNPPATRCGLIHVEDGGAPRYIMATQSKCHAVAQCFLASILNSPVYVKLILERYHKSPMVSVCTSAMRNPEQRNMDTLASFATLGKLAEKIYQWLSRQDGDFECLVTDVGDIMLASRNEGFDGEEPEICNKLFQLVSLIITPSYSYSSEHGIESLKIDESKLTEIVSFDVDRSTKQLESFMEDQLLKDAEHVEFRWNSRECANEQDEFDLFGLPTSLSNDEFVLSSFIALYEDTQTLVTVFSHENNPDHYFVASSAVRGVYPLPTNSFWNWLAVEGKAQIGTIIDDESDEMAQFFRCIFTRGRARAGISMTSHVFDNHFKIIYASYVRSSVTGYTVGDRFPIPLFIKDNGPHHAVSDPRVIQMDLNEFALMRYFCLYLEDLVKTSQLNTPEAHELCFERSKDLLYYNPYSFNNTCPNFSDWDLYLEDNDKETDKIMAMCITGYPPAMKYRISMQVSFFLPSGYLSFCHPEATSLQCRTCSLAGCAKVFSEPISNWLNFPSTYIRLYIFERLLNELQNTTYQTFPCLKRTVTLEGSDLFRTVQARVSTEHGSLTCTGLEHAFHAAKTLMRENSVNGQRRFTLSLSSKEKPVPRQRLPTKWGDLNNFSIQPSVLEATSTVELSLTKLLEADVLCKACGIAMPLNEPQFSNVCSDYCKRLLIVRKFSQQLVKPACIDVVLPHYMTITLKATPSTLVSKLYAAVSIICQHSTFLIENGEHRASTGVTENKGFSKKTEASVEYVLAFEYAGVCNEYPCYMIKKCGSTRVVLHYDFVFSEWRIKPVKCDCMPLNNCSHAGGLSDAPIWFRSKDFSKVFYDHSFSPTWIDGNVSSESLISSSAIVFGASGKGYDCTLSRYDEKSHWHEFATLYINGEADIIPLRLDLSTLGQNFRRYICPNPVFAAGALILVPGYAWIVEKTFTILPDLTGCYPIEGGRTWNTVHHTREGNTFEVQVTSQQKHLPGGLLYGPHSQRPTTLIGRRCQNSHAAVFEPITLLTEYYHLNSNQSMLVHRSHTGREEYPITNRSPFFLKYSDGKKDWYVLTAVAKYLFVFSTTSCNGRYVLLDRWYMGAPVYAKFSDEHHGPKPVAPLPHSCDKFDCHNAVLFYSADSGWSIVNYSQFSRRETFDLQADGYILPIYVDSTNSTPFANTDTLKSQHSKEPRAVIIARSSDIMDLEPDSLSFLDTPLLTTTQTMLSSTCSIIHTDDSICDPTKMKKSTKSMFTSCYPYVFLPLVSHTNIKFRNALFKDCNPSWTKFLNRSFWKVASNLIFNGSYFRKQVPYDRNRHLTQVFDKQSLKICTQALVEYDASLWNDLEPDNTPPSFEFGIPVYFYRSRQNNAVYALPTCHSMRSSMNRFIKKAKPNYRPTRPYGPSTRALKPPDLLFEESDEDAESATQTVTECPSPPMRMTADTQLGTISDKHTVDSPPLAITMESAGDSSLQEICFVVTRNAILEAFITSGSIIMSLSELSLALSKRTDQARTFKEAKQRIARIIGRPNIGLAVVIKTLCDGFFAVDNQSIQLGTLNEISSAIFNDYSRSKFTLSDYAGQVPYIQLIANDIHIIQLVKTRITGDISSLMKQEVLDIDLNSLDIVYAILLIGQLISESPAKHLTVYDHKIISDKDDRTTSLLEAYQLDLPNPGVLDNPGIAKVLSSPHIYEIFYASIAGRATYVQPDEVLSVVCSDNDEILKRNHNSNIDSEPSADEIKISCFSDVNLCTAVAAELSGSLLLFPAGLVSSASSILPCVKGSRPSPTSDSQAEAETPSATSAVKTKTRDDLSNVLQSPDMVYQLTGLTSEKLIMPDKDKPFFFWVHPGFCVHPALQQHDNIPVTGSVIRSVLCPSYMNAT